MTDNLSAPSFAPTTVQRLASSTAGRRTFLTGAAAGAASLVFAAGVPSASAAGNPIPTLPGEVSRMSNQVTAKGRVLYENILVSINGDQARIFVPHTVVPKQTQAGVVWFYHATGSTHTALNSAFKYSAELVTDQGAISICQNLGGDAFTNPAAQQLQRDGWAYLSSQFTIGVNFLRANSGGGGMACATYGGKLMPKIRGMYLASAAYDMEKLYASDPVRVGRAYGNSPSAVAANNPARLPASAWAGTRVRAALAADSNPDPVVPGKDHGGALVRKITTPTKVAVEATTREYTDGGHQVPSWVSGDMMAAFSRWL